MRKERILIKIKKRNDGLFVREKLKYSWSEELSTIAYCVG